MKQAEQPDEIGDRLVIAEILMRRLAPRQPHHAEDDEVSDLMRDGVEVEGERLRLAARFVLTHLQETVAGLSVVPFQPRNYLQATVGRLKEPRDLAAEIALADVEHSPPTGIAMRGLELRRADRDVVEMSVRPRHRRGPQSAGIRGKIGELIRLLFDQRIDDIHTLVGWAGPDPP